MNIQSIFKTTALSLFLLSGLTACAQAPAPAPTIEPVAVRNSCDMDQHKKLQAAIAGAQKVLSQRACHYRFEDLHKTLLHTGEGDPSPENGKKFLIFYKWSVEQDIISSRQGKEYYNRYFKTTFGNVLSNDRNVCSLGKSKHKLIKKLNSELVDKKIGLQDIMQNRDAYFEAQRIHNDLIFLIETTLMACNDRK